MSDFLAAFGLVLVLEGLLYAVSPGLVRRLLEFVGSVPEQTLRTGGLVAAIVGVGIVWLARG